MPFTIKCSDKNCGKETWVDNIVDLIEYHRDKDGWFICACKQKGYILKSFNLQEEGKVWEPYLHGIITLGDEEDTYQPFVFNVSYSPDAKTDSSLWFSYYKDLREIGGRLKLGYGPGGPPVLDKDMFMDLIRQLINLNIMTKQEINSLLNEEK
jgi:hypothetical protein